MPLLHDTTHHCNMCSCHVTMPTQGEKSTQAETVKRPNGTDVRTEHTQQTKKGPPTHQAYSLFLRGLHGPFKSVKWGVHMHRGMADTGVALARHANTHTTHTTPHAGAHTSSSMQPRRVESK
jgi:hypothetical protein